MDKIGEIIGVLLNDPLGRTLIGAAGGALARAGVGIRNFRRNRHRVQPERDFEVVERDLERIAFGLVAAGGSLMGSMVLATPGITAALGKIAAGGEVALGAITGYTGVDAGVTWLRHIV